MFFSRLKEVGGSFRFEGLRKVEQLDVGFLSRIGGTTSVSGNSNPLTITTSSCVQFSGITGVVIIAPPQVDCTDATAPCTPESLGCWVNGTTVDCSCRGVVGHHLELSLNTLAVPADTLILDGNNITGLAVTGGEKLTHLYTHSHSHSHSHSH